MATAEILRPTAYTVDDGTVNNPVNAYDANVGTWATVEGAAETDVSHITYHTFPSGAIANTKRAQVLLQVYGTWGTTDPNDKMGVYMRAKPADPWTLIISTKPPNDWTGWLVFDVTDLMGVQDLSTAQVQVTFGNFGTGSSDDPILPTGE